jgi:DNA-binding CsgD family transcriptional regulator
MIGFRPAADPAVSPELDIGQIIHEHVRRIVSGLPASVLTAEPSADEPTIVRNVSVGEQRFRLVVDLLPPDANGDRLPIATVQRLDADGLSESALRQRFRLTRKESHVALLLAQRRSNAEIAETLRISPHTARRHTENVMLKLNVSSRYSVEAALGGTH